MDFPIELVGLFIGISIGVPLMVGIFDKSEHRLIFMFTMLFVGIMWIFIWFNVDNIILDDQLASATTTGDTITLVWDDNKYPLIDEITGEPTLDKIFITFLGLIWILVPMVGEVQRRRGGGF